MTWHEFNVTLAFYFAEETLYILISKFIEIIKFSYYLLLRTRHVPENKVVKCFLHSLVLFYRFEEPRLANFYEIIENEINAFISWFLCFKISIRLHAKYWWKYFNNCDTDIQFVKHVYCLIALIRGELRLCLLIIELLRFLVKRVWWIWIPVCLI